MDLTPPSVRLAPGAPPFSLVWSISSPSSYSVVVPFGCPGVHLPPATPFPVRELRRIVGHGAVAMGHYVEVVRDGLREAHLVVQIGSRLITALDDLAEAIAHARVAGRAVDVEALLAALEHFHRYREGHYILLFR